MQPSDYKDSHLPATKEYFIKGINSDLTPQNYAIDKQ